MSFLPFVLSFLLILILGSSVLFTSFRSTTLEKTIILAHHEAHRCLISEQAKREYKLILSPKKVNPPPPKGNSKSKSQEYRDKRNELTDLDSAKLNLWPILRGDSTNLSKAVYESAVRLVQILYQDADFYKASPNKELARAIVNEMIEQKGETLLDLFPKDAALAPIYYKMLKGTNTGYPPLGAYFKIENCEKGQPLAFSYVSTPILRAVFGDETAARILAAEKASWEENHKKRILPKEKLRELLQHHPTPFFDITQLETVFSFGKQKKGAPHAFVEPSTKVMATRR